MFEISVQAEFSAAHAIVIGGKREPVHGHDWRVTATVASGDLDQNGLLCDFHDVERALRSITSPMNNASLNDLPPFRDGLNPTAENVARHIGDRLVATLRLPAGARLASVRVTEAPGCAATYTPPHGATDNRGGPR